tara:strand:+ start:273 stop:563 length:291 start_codon:yes stop_codon:yes gene_type:complete
MENDKKNSMSRVEWIRNSIKKGKLPYIEATDDGFLVSWKMSEEAVPQKEDVWSSIPGCRLGEFLEYVLGPGSGKINKRRPKHTKQVGKKDAGNTST